MYYFRYSIAVFPYLWSSARTIDPPLLGNFTRYTIPICRSFSGVSQHRDPLASPWTGYPNKSDWTFVSAIWIGSGSIDGRESDLTRRKYPEHPTPFSFEHRASKSQTSTALPAERCSATSILFHLLHRLLEQFHSLSFVSCHRFLNFCSLLSESLCFFHSLVVSSAESKMRCTQEAR